MAFRREDYDHFFYRYLSSPTTDIRVIELQITSTFDAPLKCRMFNTEIHNRPYQTLSYCWGEDEKTHSIHCRNEISSGHVKITASLDQALRRVRQEYHENDVSSSDLPLWVDALCIDQDYRIEKSIQVRKMGHIYATAERLAVWLGDLMSTEDDETVSNLCSRVATGQTLKFVPTTHQSSLQALLRSKWFGRRWVVQELFSAPKETIWMLFGSHSVLYIDLARLLDQSGMMYEAGPIAHDRRLRRKAGINSEASRSLLDNLLRLDNFQCRDDRDIIFALLSISADEVIGPDPDRGLIVPNYTLDADALLVMVALGYAMDERFITPLLMAASCRNKAKEGLDSALPSWVPDWRLEVRHVSAQHRAATDLRGSIAALDNYHFCDRDKYCSGMRTNFGSCPYEVFCKPEITDEVLTVSGTLMYQRSQDLPDLSEKHCIHDTSADRSTQAVNKQRCIYALLRNLPSTQALLFLSLGRGISHTGFILATADHTVPSSQSNFLLYSCFRDTDCVDCMNLFYEHILVEHDCRVRIL